MSIPVNSITSATAATYNLSRSNHAFRSRLQKLSSGKRINGSDDEEGLAASHESRSEGNCTLAKIRNIQNSISYLKVQDGTCRTLRKISDGIPELRVIADACSETAAEQIRVTNTLDYVEQNHIEAEAAHGRTVYAQMAFEPTKFARHKILVRAGAVITVHADQFTNIDLQLRE